MLKKLMKVLPAVAWLVFCATYVFAQSPAPVPAPGAPNLPDIVTKLIAAATIALVPALTYFVRVYLVPKVPRILVPIVLVPLISGALDFVAKTMTGGSMNWLAIAGLSAAAVYLREILNTFNEHGING